MARKNASGGKRRCPRRVTFATEFSGLNAPAFALKGMSVKCALMFDTDIKRACRQISSAYHEANQVFGDITTRNVDILPSVHYYHFSPPCISYSAEGKQDGAGANVGRLW